MSNLLNFKSFFKFLSRRKAFTAINVFGLSVSLMFVILIAVYVSQGVSTDRFQEKRARIYVLGNESYIGSAWRIGERIAGHYPEIEKMCPTVHSWEVPVFIEEDKYKANVLYTNGNFFDMFTFPLTQGDSHTVLEVKDYAVISETFAKKVFSDRDPLGGYIKVNDSLTVRVNGIMKDIRNSSIPYSDVVVHINNVRFMNPSLDSEPGNNSAGCQVFFQAVEGADIQAKAEEIAAFLKEFFWIYERGLVEKVILTPLSEIYFSEIKCSTGLMQSDWNFVVVFMLIGILILIFAVINYINLTVAQTGSRAKEMATRRLLGSSRGDLFIRLIMESTLLCMISFIVGILLAVAVQPYANDLLHATIDIKSNITFTNCILSLLLVLGTGFIAGFLPAVIISNSKPIDIVKGGFRTKTKMIFSKVFITFQNVITIILLAASLTMILQINHMIKAPLGYNKTNIMYVPTYQFESREKINTFVNELRQLAAVKRAGLGQGSPFDRGNNSTVVYEEKNISFQFLAGDSTYFNMLGFEIIHQNNVTSGSQVYLNEQTLVETGLPMDVTELKLWEGRDPYIITGIIRDFQLRNILQKKEPVIIEVRKEEDILYPWNVMIEIEGDPYVARDHVKGVYERVSKLDFTGQYVDQQIEDSYAEQNRMAQLVIVFTVIAILISLLGLLAMSTYFIQQRSREVSVRKVFGSTNAQVLNRLIWRFLSFVLIAFVVATPLVWGIMQEWLSDYSYRITLAPWIFIAAGGFCLVVSFITVFWQSYRAANANPVESIKAE